MVKFEYVLLALLAGRPRSGFDLGRWVETEGQFLRSRAHHSHIYRLLGRMDTDGWIAYEVDPRDGRPDAKVYRLRPRGREVLLDWVRSPYEPTSRFQDPDFLARFAFAAPLDAEAAIRLVRTELAYRREQIARNRERDRTLGFQDPLPELDPGLAQEIFDELHRHGASAVDTWVAWLERMLHRLEARRTQRGNTPA
ncbi:helix-turn-helix transcriptional regulator [Streptomyces sp. ISL-43]|uniref:helix-turn-helix transcriptional regulator n=1 Tax=Streptomyces sp. ISL-43 TaxID=2819183 RepID=UPI001BE6A186|nr:helix-turn-helix transcriptional regulator [Streptomyces sp. ISL-43]MBT2449598.1 helix-turn-helix transcriptional regulator [Streptomyces sp. ISL-43]